MQVLKALPGGRALIGWRFFPPLHGCRMRPEVIQVILPMKFCLGRTTVLKGLLLQNPVWLPQTPYTISNGLRSFMPLQIEL